LTALSLYEQCLAMYRRFGSHAEIGGALCNIASVQQDMGQHLEALALIVDALREADIVDSDVIRAQALFLRGKIEQQQGQNDVAVATLTSAVDFAASAGELRFERDARTGLGMALKALGKLDASIPLFREALALTRRSAFPALGWVLDQLADALQRQGAELLERRELEPALLCFMEVVDISRDPASSCGSGHGMRGIATAQELLQRYADAVEGYRRASTALFGTGDIQEADDAAFRAAELSVGLGRRDFASAVFEEVLLRTADYSGFSERMKRMGVLANAFLEQEQVGNGVWILEECLRLNWRAGYPADAAVCLLNLGHIAQATGGISRARDCFAQAVEILEDAPHPMLATARKMLQDAHEAQPTGTDGTHS